MTVILFVTAVIIICDVIWNKAYHGKQYCLKLHFVVLKYS